MTNDISSCRASIYLKVAGETGKVPVNDRLTVTRVFSGSKTSTQGNACVMKLSGKACLPYTKSRSTYVHIPFQCEVYNLHKLNPNTALFVLPVGLHYVLIHKYKWMHVDNIVSISTPLYRRCFWIASFSSKAVCVCVCVCVLEATLTL